MPTPHEILDMTVMPEFRASVSFEMQPGTSPVHATGATGASATVTNSPEETPMDPVTPKIDTTAIHAAATKAVEDLFAKRDSQAAVAAHIIAIQTEAAQAKASLAVAQSENTTLKGQISTLEQAEAAAKVAKKKKEDDDAQNDIDNKAKKEKAEADLKAATDELAKVKGELATATKTLTEQATAAKKADRAKKVDDKKVKGKFKDRAMATNEDGTLKMSDDEFDAQLADLAETAGTTQATAAGTPAPATPPAATTPAPASADLGAADAHAQATAALMVAGEPAKQSDGRKNYATMFGAS